MKLKGYKSIEGIMEVITGLHIGGNTATIEIGGKDNPVIKHPVTNEPYVLGSSLKGKMRALLEWKLSLIDMRPKVDGEPNNDYGSVHKYGKGKCLLNKCPICLIFGTSADDAALGPTRIIVRDSFIEEEYRKELKKNPNWTSSDLTEDKWENTINRISAKANPRNFERVIPSAKFSLDIRYRVFDHLDERQQNIDETLFAYVIDGLRLVEKDALGGAGSRGCGQIKFKIKIGDDYKDLAEVTPDMFPTQSEN